MNIYGIRDCLPALEEIGCTLSNPERYFCSQMGLLQLIDLANADQLLFWGKINTLQTPYYISMSIDFKDNYAFPLKKFYYSTGNFVFQQLPPLDKFNQDKVEQFAHLPFEGDPAKILINIQGEEGQENKEAVEKKQNEDSDEDEQDKIEPKNLTELDRLGYTVRAIESECQVAPIGGFRMCELHEVRYNECFKGLNSKCVSLKQFQHFRYPQNEGVLQKMEEAGSIFRNDFLDPIANESEWSLQLDCSESWVTVRQLLWQGYVGFHKFGTQQFGGVYFGNGIKMADMPLFM